MAEPQTKRRKSTFDPLLTESNPNNRKQSDQSQQFISLYKSLCGCICNTLLCPLHIITYPLIYLLDGLSCWKNKKYQQHDLSFQFIGVFQNLVALFWSNSLVSMIEYLLHEQSLNLKHTNFTLLITVSYAFIMYILSIFIILIVAKLNILSDRITFFVGLFVRIIAFGVKDLGFEIQDIYFANSFESALSFFFIQLFVAIIFIISLSTLRSKLCPNRFNGGQKEDIDDGEISEDGKHDKKSKKRNNKHDKIHQKRMAKKKRHEDLYKKRLQNKVRAMNFNRLLNGLDADIWTISLGFCLVEVVICGLSGIWIPLEASVVHDESIDDIEATYFLYLFLSICIIWVIWLNCIAWFEMIRDRVYQKVFLMANYVQIGQTNIDQYYDDYIITYTNILHQGSENGNKLSRHHGEKTFNYSNLSWSNNDSLSRKPTFDRLSTARDNKSYLLFPKRISPTGAQATRTSNNTNNSSTDGDSSSNLSGWTVKTQQQQQPRFGSTSSFHKLSFGYRFLFYSGFKYKNAMDRFVAFMDGILGWSMGWSMAGAIFISYHYQYRSIYAVVATILCVTMEICRNFYIHKNINSWYDVSKKRRRLFKQTVDDIEHKLTMIDRQYYKDTMDMTDTAEIEKQRQKALEDKRKLNIRKQEVILAATTILPECEEVEPEDKIIHDELKEDKEDENHDQHQRPNLAKKLTFNSVISLSYAEDEHQPHPHHQQSTIPLNKNLSRMSKSIDESDIASSINIGIKKIPTADTKNPLYRTTSSRFNLVEYIRRKTSVTPRRTSTATYLSSSLDITDPRKRHINLGIMSNKEHKAVYVYNHISVTWRKAIGLVLAIVWTTAVVSLLDSPINFLLDSNTNYNEHIAFKYNMITMVCITIIATYLGMRFTDIKTKYAGYSNADITKRFIQAYHQDVLETRQNIANKFQLD